MTFFSKILALILPHLRYWSQPQSSSSLTSNGQSTTPLQWSDPGMQGPFSQRNMSGVQASSSSTSSAYESVQMCDDLCSSVWILHHNSDAKGEVNENHWFVAQSTMSCDENENKLYNRNAANDLQRKTFSCSNQRT